MSRPRYWWYGNVCRAIGAFPEMQAREKKLVGRERQEYNAIKSAISAAEAWGDGKEVLNIVRARSWGSRQESFDNIAEREFMATNTAKRRYSRFVYTVAENMGYRKLG